MTQPSDRVYHDVNLGAFAGRSVRLSLWFYDVLDTRPYSFEPFDIRNAETTQVLGVGADYSGYVYKCRVLTAADGSAGPNWVYTPIKRSVGWHQFEIDQYRGANAGKVEFYIDGALAYRNTNAYDVTANRIVLGLGWPGNLYQSGYVDDVSFSAIPEPSCLIGLGAGLVGCMAFALRRRRASCV